MATSTLREFTIDATSTWRATSPWGGGHTHETDPTQKGWILRVLRARTPGLCLLGQRGQSGCATVSPIGCGAFDVALYLERPQTIEKGLGTGSLPTPITFIWVASTPGWGLTVIEEIERIRRECADDLE